MSSESLLPLFGNAHQHPERIAIISDGHYYSYGELLAAARSWAGHLLGTRNDLEEERVAFLVRAGFDYAAVQWGIWLAGGIAVPLCLSAPEPELAHVVTDSGARTLVADSERIAQLGELGTQPDVELVQTGEPLPDPPADLPRVESRRRALILYTSGTTARPKGVVITLDALWSQIETLVEAWRWSREDHILSVLPLHHTHGIVNVCGCALASAATCEMLPRFDTAQVWEAFEHRPLTLFMAVPTIYSRLINYWNEQSRARRAELSRACRRFRLMVSGSAALPAETLQRWHDISGHTLLERYGMTELGMALSNPLEGERRAGTVGQPLPGVEVRVTDDEGAVMEKPGAAGELEVRGPGVFREYWRQPRLTSESFRDGWFCTGDVVTIEDGYYRILGRRSVDIIKSGGYKLSALEIEEVLQTHPEIEECSVIGISDPEWGERVCAAVQLRQGHELTLDELREWGASRLARHKLPSRLEAVPELPRNAMGKVTKTQVRKLFEESEDP